MFEIVFILFEMCVCVCVFDVHKISMATMPMKDESPEPFLHAKIRKMEEIFWRASSCKNG